MNEKELLGRITFNLDIFGGKPIIRGHRLAVEHVLGMLAAGDTPQTLREGYDWLEPEDIQACLVYAKHLVAQVRGVTSGIHADPLQEIRVKLSALHDILQAEAEDHNAALIQEALEGTDEELKEFIVSNELWGGAGSIADQACMSAREEVKRKFYSIFEDIGALQIKMGLVNARTESWTHSFKAWYF